MDFLTKFDRFDFEEPVSLAEIPYSERPVILPEDTLLNRQHWDSCLQCCSLNPQKYQYCFSCWFLSKGLALYKKNPYDFVGRIKENYPRAHLHAFDSVALPEDEELLETWTNSPTPESKARREKNDEQERKKRRKEAELLRYNKKVGMTFAVQATQEYIEKRRLSARKKAIQQLNEKSSGNGRQSSKAKQPTTTRQPGATKKQALSTTVYEQQSTDRAMSDIAEDYNDGGHGDWATDEDDLALYSDDYSDSENEHSQTAEEAYIRPGTEQEVAHQIAHDEYNLDVYHRALTKQQELQLEQLQAPNMEFVMPTLNVPGLSEEPELRKPILPESHLEHVELDIAEEDDDEAIIRKPAKFDDNAIVQDSKERSIKATAQTFDRAPVNEEATAEQTGFFLPTQTTEAESPDSEQFHHSEQSSPVTQAKDKRPARKSRPDATGPPGAKKKRGVASNGKKSAGKLASLRKTRK